MRFQPGFLALAFGVLAASVALACNVPVYRYALDHWQPDQYRATVLHQGPLPSAELAQLESLRQKAAQGRLNLAIRTLDLSSPLQPADEPVVAAARAAGELTGPARLVLQYPEHLEIDQPIASAALTSADEAGKSELARLLDSPLRREIVQRLAGGLTAVWLMVDSGNADQDAQAATTLETELRALEQSLQLPTLTDSPEDALTGGPELRIEFELLRVGRDDADEQGLLAMLLGSEPDLHSVDEPVVFPIFGRSRALLPLVGGGISPRNIEGSSAFLVGACSCQVKELNPGFDLLLESDWSKLIDWVTPAATGVASAGPHASAALEPKLVAIPSGAGSEEVRPDAATTVAVAQASIAEPSEAAKLESPAAELSLASEAGATSRFAPLVFSLVFLVAIAAVGLLTLRKAAVRS
jgi:hypothetical protein